jgi:hypothetical protein
LINKKKNPYAPKTMVEYASPYKSDRLNIQEIIFYCASRLRAALIALAIEVNPRIQTWKKDIYSIELVS